MNIPLKSVILMIGPSGCGKSTFIENQLVPQLKALVPDANIQVLSSDAYRREIVGLDLDKADDRMNYASEGAFKLMEAKFAAVTTWPMSADFVIIDATNIGEKSRQMWVDAAAKARYQLVGFCFDFNDREDYFKFTEPGHGWLIGNHLKRFKQETMGELRKKDFDHFYKIKSKTAEITLEADPSYAVSAISKLPKFNQYFVIGDIHGCLTELKALLTVAGFTIVDNMIEGKYDTLIILAGDLVDKGNEVNELMEFITENIARIKVNIGNHDHALIRFITNNVNDKARDENIAKYFDSFAKMTDKAKEQFMAIIKNSSYFYFHDHFVVTHAPCANSRIGKFDARSLKDQGNCSYGWRKDYESDEAFVEGVKKAIPFIFEENRKNDPHHFFGHIAVSEPTAFGNKVFLDTGCAYGNKLSGAIFSTHNRSISFRSVPSGQPAEAAVGDMINFNKEKKSRTTFESLEFEDKMEVVRMARAKVNFVSGTMSPCDKNEKERTLEDMREAFGYFKEKGVTRLMLQKKYMGSRANMYLFPHDLDKSYMVSRNGYVIKNLDLKPLFASMAKDQAAAEDELLYIFDGELMPWSAMGRGLIDSHFVTTGVGIETELKLLEDTGFEQALENLRAKYDSSGYKDLKKQHKKEELIKVMGDGSYRLMSSFEGFKWHPVAIQRAAISVYNKQMELYGSEGELEFKGFSLLKVVKKDGTEETFFDKSNEDVYTTASMKLDNYLIVNTDDAGLASAKEWFRARVEEGVEGVVVKPADVVYIPGVAPYMKVRNPNYLTIIYGYDYLTEPKFTKMLEHKSIKGKLKTSIREFEIGKAMLEIPYAEINENNVKYLDLCAQMVVEEKHEKSLDPRL